MSKVVALRPDSSVAPNLLNGKVPPPRVSNAERRSREYLTDSEVEALMTAHDPPWGREASQSIGYEQIREARVAGEDARLRIPVIQQRTRHFARSQLTWFRKLPVEWWGEDEHDALLASLEAGLNVYRRQGRWPEPDPARGSLPRESEKPL